MWWQSSGLCQIPTAWTVSVCVFGMPVFVCVFKSQHHFVSPPLPLLIIIIISINIIIICICYTPKQPEPRRWMMNNWNLKLKIKNYKCKWLNPKHWAVLPLIELEDVAKALCSWRKKRKKKKKTTATWELCPKNMYILLWHKCYCGCYGPPAYIGILDFNGHLQRER